tara:strand:+ start:3637 stop:4257 length:621 start_codon:yes stop_codon:yes gene_type:complete
MNFKNNKIRIITQRIHDYILFRMIAILKASDLGRFHSTKKSYFFSENIGIESSLGFCDGSLFTTEKYENSQGYTSSKKNPDDTLYIEMKTKSSIDHSKQSIKAAIESIYTGEAKVNPKIYNYNHLVILGVYTKSEKDRFDFSSSKILLKFGDHSRSYWTNYYTLDEWKMILMEANSISSLFNVLGHDVMKAEDLPKSAIEWNQDRL